MDSVDWVGGPAVSGGAVGGAAQGDIAVERREAVDGGQL
jgi:hypothetical protein